MLQICKENNLDVYQYLILKALYDDDSDSFEGIIFNYKTHYSKYDAFGKLIKPLIINEYIVSTDELNLVLTSKGKILFDNIDKTYLEVMHAYPNTITVYGVPYPAWLPDKKCIELMSSIDSTQIADIKRAIEYGIEHELLNMKFDKFIETKFYLEILKQIEDKSDNNNIYDKGF